MLNRSTALIGKRTHFSTENSPPSGFSPPSPAGLSKRRGGRLSTGFLSVGGLPSPPWGLDPSPSGLRTILLMPAPRTAGKRITQQNRHASVSQRESVTKCKKEKKKLFWRQKETLKKVGELHCDRSKNRLAAYLGAFQKKVLIGSITGSLPNNTYSVTPWHTVHWPWICVTTSPTDRPSYQNRSPPQQGSSWPPRSPSTCLILSPPT